MKIVFAHALFVCIHLVTAQTPLAAVYYSGFNSSFSLTPSQIKAAQLGTDLAESVQNVINYDRTQLAFGGPEEDDFYTLPPLTNETGPLKPGELLKVQPFTDPTAYAIPPNTAISRIMYTTTTFNGTVVPTSAFILWPYTPHKFGDSPYAAKETSNTKASIVLWNHGTSGFFPPQSPSSHRGLWYDNAAPFAIAQAGYAVFAPDFAGLGIHKTWDGSEILHQYHASPATARDALYGLRAALEAFPGLLEPNFVAMGHSQGGGVAWAIAEAMASEQDEFADLVPAYKGAIGASPTTKVFSGPPSFMLPTVGQMLHSIFPTFNISEWLTPKGVARLDLIKEMEGGIGVFQQLLVGHDDFVQPHWNETWYVDAFSKLADAGRKDFKGPLLVIEGSEDPVVPYEVTAQSVKDTSALYPDHDLQFLVAAGVAHVPILSATRQFWLQWIEDRLGDKALTEKGIVRTDLQSLLPIEQYLKVGNSFPAWAGLPEHSYQVVLGF